MTNRVSDAVDFAARSSARGESSCGPWKYPAAGGPRRLWSRQSTRNPPPDFSGRFSSLPQGRSGGRRWSGPELPDGIPIPFHKFSPVRTMRRSMNSPIPKLPGQVFHGDLRVDSRRRDLRTVSRRAPEVPADFRFRSGSRRAGFAVLAHGSRPGAIVQPPIWVEPARQARGPHRAGGQRSRCFRPCCWPIRPTASVAGARPHRPGKWMAAFDQKEASRRRRAEQGNQGHEAAIGSISPPQQQRANAIPVVGQVISIIGLALSLAIQEALLKGLSAALSQTADQVHDGYEGRDLLCRSGVDRGRLPAHEAVGGKTRWRLSCRLVPFRDRVPVCADDPRHVQATIRGRNYTTQLGGRSGTRGQSRLQQHWGP